MSATGRRSRASISSSTSSARQPSRAREGLRDCRLARGHEAHEVDLVRPSPRQPLERLEEARIRDRRPTTPRMIVGRARAGRGDRKGHRQPMVVRGVDRCRPSAAGRHETEAVRDIPRPLAPEVRRPRARQVMRSLSLTRSSPAPRTTISAPSGSSAPSAASPGISSMRPGTSSRVDVEAARGSVRYADPSHRLAARLVSIGVHVNLGPRPAEHLEHRGARGIQADAFDVDRRPLACRRQGEPERRRSKCRPEPSRSRRT